MAEKIPYHQILQIVQQYNILPIISRCNIHCCFCSHQQNPPGIASYSLPPLNLEQIDEMIEFLSPSNKIVIGESVSRVMEGEPFLFPNFIEVLQRIRRKFPRTLIGVTTNGSLLDEQIVKSLSQLMPLEINLSLNSANPQHRQTWLKDLRADIAINSPVLLNQYRIPFHGSIVALPHLTGWEDLGNSIRYLNDWGCQTIRVFVPGYTRWCKADIQPNFSFRELADFIEQLPGIDCPVTVEPSMTQDLMPNILGTMSGTPARQAGLKKNDVILKIDEIPPFSRVDAFLKLKKKGTSCLTVRRGQETLNLILKKQPGEPPGIVMQYDLHPLVIQEILDLIKHHQAQKPIIATSTLAYPVMAAAFAVQIRVEKAQVVEIKNRFFGGNIRCAGLLMVEDFIKGLAGRQGDLIIVPPIAFDSNGRDLRGQHYSDIGQHLGIPAVLPY
jgi:NifB/MoaA-like Fe-S oxidoreductase